MTRRPSPPLPPPRKPTPLPGRPTRRRVPPSRSDDGGVAQPLALHHRHGRATGPLLALLLLVAAWSGAFAQGEAGAWELRVCAQPDNLPFSTRDGAGLENRIATLLADELGADLALHRLPRPTAEDQRLALRSGECDVVMGVNDGAPGFLTTVAYYRSHPVFVQREDAAAPVASLDDPALQDLRIGVLAGGGARATQLALAQRGLLDDVTSFAWDAEGESPLGAPVRAVARGELDVALVWGPVGGWFAAQQDVPLSVRPAEPLMELPAYNTVVPVAIGVRPGDEALRDLLDRALAARWDDVQEVLDAYHVPRLETPRPTRGGGVGTRGPVIGVILPLPTGDTPLDASDPVIAATAARMGAEAAVEDLTRAAAPEGAGPPPELRTSSAPTAEAARRAARRLIRADGAVALVGGLGGSGSVLSAVAASHAVPFLNVGDPSHALREACPPWTVHVAPDEAAQLEAIAHWFVDDGLHDWFLLHGDDAKGRALADLAAEALAREDASVVGRAGIGEALRPDQALSAVAAAEPDAVLALLDWRAQLDLAGLYDALGPDAVLVGLPTPATQTRDFYGAWGDAVGDADALRRTATWEAALDEGAAGALNESFLARWGRPMDGPAWTAYQAVAILGRAFAADAAARGEALLDRLLDPEVVADATLDVGYDAPARQLLPSLHRVEIRPDAARPLAWARPLASTASSVQAHCPATEE